ncbi:hypothetical protein [Bradyrhizobium sp. SSUT77]|uniref:hypothetical protein n=1 Tax=Bradyrhizobium sp. SSUT77 TaxID=3040603 RepID=UPI00244CD978|nr:hypothetical protein [Bradyrhizobium sp. SSUT77]MDH2341383.1 hypothetical protein [Bradyrhizobium sp. SSUT77]
MRRATAVLLALLLAAHAPMLLNDGLFMDDWLVLKPRPDFMIDIDFLLRGAGHPIFFSYDTFANWTGAPIAVMVSLAFAGILLGAMSLALTATRLDLLDRAEAVGFALMVWTYPGYQLWAGKANAVYVLSFGLLFFGAWLLMLAYGARGMRCALLRLACVLAFMLSFALNSTIVLYAFVMLGLFIAVWRSGDAAQGLIQRTWRAAWYCVTRYPELAVLPPVYWGALNIWFKRTGVYAQHYNAHFPTLSELARGWQLFFVTSYWDVVATAFQLAIGASALLVAAVLLVSAAVFLLSSEAEPTAARYGIVAPLLLAVALFLALSFPYLVAGLQPSATHFYESRHLLMFGLPSALTLFALKRWAERAIGPKAAFMVVFGVGSVLSIGVLWNTYIFMQARTLKQEALAKDLASRAQPAATVFALDDGFVDYPSRHVPFGFAEVSGMLRLAWGNQPFVGFALRAERPSVLQELEVARTAPSSAFSHLDPSGPQATISFQPGPAAAPNQALVQKYYACRLLARCEVSQLLDQIARVTIKMGPIAGILPLDGAKPSR